MMYSILIRKNTSKQLHINGYSYFEMEQLTAIKIGKSMEDRSRIRRMNTSTARDQNNKKLN